MKPLLPTLLLPLGLAMLVYVLGALFFYRAAGRELLGQVEAPLKNPFELGPALRFAALLVLVLFLVEAAQHWLGDVGIYLVSLFSGMSDVDAITLSLARSARGELAADIASRGIFDGDGNALPTISVFDKFVARKTSESGGK